MTNIFLHFQEFPFLSIGKWLNLYEKRESEVNLLLIHTVQYGSYFTRLLYYICPHADYEDNAKGVL